MVHWSVHVLEFSKCSLSTSNVPGPGKGSGQTAAHEQAVFPLSELEGAIKEASKKPQQWNVKIIVECALLRFTIQYRLTWLLF